MCERVVEAKRFGEEDEEGKTLRKCVHGESENMSTRREREREMCTQREKRR